MLAPSQHAPTVEFAQNSTLHIRLDKYHLTSEKDCLFASKDIHYLTNQSFSHYQEEKQQQLFNLLTEAGKHCHAVQEN